MVRGGWSSHEACFLIYEVYGHSSTVTYIIIEMRKDGGNGGKPVTPHYTNINKIRNFFTTRLSKKNLDEWMLVR